MALDARTTSGVTMLGILSCVFCLTQSLITSAAPAPRKSSVRASASYESLLSWTKREDNGRLGSDHKALAMESSTSCCEWSDFNNAAVAWCRVSSLTLAGTESAWRMAARVWPSEPVSAMVSATKTLSGETNRFSCLCAATRPMSWSPKSLRAVAAILLFSGCTGPLAFVAGALFGFLGVCAVAHAIIRTIHHKPQGFIFQLLRINSDRVSHGLP